jgi:hypothetical protein
VLFIFTVQIFTHFILLCEVRWGEVTNFLVYCKGPSTEQKLGCEHEAIEAAVPAATLSILLLCTTGKKKDKVRRRTPCADFIFFKEQ